MGPLCVYKSLLQPTTTFHFDLQRHKPYRMWGMFIHDTWHLIRIPNKYCNNVSCGIESMFSITNQIIKWKWSHMWRRWLDLQGTYLSLFVNTNWNLYVIHSKYIFYVLIGTMYIINGLNSYRRIYDSVAKNIIT